MVNGILMYGETPLNGLVEAHFDSGKINFKTNYAEGRKEGLKTGIHKAWWQNGKPKFVYHFNDKGEYNGNVKEWYASGLLLEILII